MKEMFVLMFWMQCYISYAFMQFIRQFWIKYRLSPSGLICCIMPVFPYYSFFLLMFIDVSEMLESITIIVL